MRSLALCLLVAAAPALAKEKWDVKLPDSVEVAGKTLKLNGMGLRQKFIVRVYVAGLYLEQTSRDASKVLASDGPRRVEMKMLRDLDKKTVAEAIQGGFEKNAGKQMPALKERMDKMIASLTELKKGQTLLITWVPGAGTTVKGPSAELTLPGKDFADAMFAVWLGQDPVDHGLKAGMLGED